MKKILSILICLIMIAAVAVSTVSADGMKTDLTVRITMTGFGTPM